MPGSLPPEDEIARLRAAIRQVLGDAGSLEATKRSPCDCNIGDCKRITRRCLEDDR